MIILSFPTSHALKPIYVFCVEPFKATLSKKIIVKWTRLILLDGSTRHKIKYCTKQNFKERFSVIKIWPFNPMTMDDKTLPLNIYITTNNNESNKEDSTSNGEVGNNQQWEGGEIC
jgi:hypothetical protein